MRHKTLRLPCGKCGKELSSSAALSLADKAIRQGRSNSAARYIELAYAIFDARAAETGTEYSNDARTAHEHAVPSGQDPD